MLHTRRYVTLRDTYFLALSRCRAQFLDAERDDPELVGFSGGYPSRSAGTRERELSLPEERESWWHVLNSLPLDERKKEQMEGKTIN